MTSMDILGLEGFQMEEFLQSDLSGSFHQNLDVENDFLGKLFPGDTWDLKESSKPSRDVFDNLSLGSGPQDAVSDPMGQDWMETTSSLEQLLGLEGPLLPTEVTEPECVEPEPRKANSQILHDLLTAPMQQLAEPNTQDATMASFDVLETIGEESAALPNVPELLIENNGIASIDEMTSLQAVLDLAPTELSFKTQIEENTTVIADSNEFLFEQCADEIMKSPLSADEIESLLSNSEPPSPNQSIDSDPDYVPSEEEQLPKRKSKSKSSNKKEKNRTIPYEVPTEGLSKKERKKLQNKNAAIRYRMKKREEMDTVKSSEDDLLNKNISLKEEVDTLTREIKYMKDLMTEVFKAKGLKITFKS